MKKKIKLLSKNRIKINPAVYILFLYMVFMGLVLAYVVISDLK